MACQRLVVLRHGLRIDETDSSWASSASRPWDPPLAAEGIDMVRHAVQTLLDFDISVVVTSPYLRCLQTSAIIVAGLESAVKCIEVDLSLGEVASLAHCAYQMPEPGEDMEAWMWQGTDVLSSCKTGLASIEQWDCDLGDLEVSITGAFPRKLPEDLVDARRRYRQALELAAERACGKNTLVVTHGEAVGAAVQRIQPTASVYEAKHCCFSLATRGLDEDGEWGFWNLASREMHSEWGVRWE